jgi:hypothetical protein
MAYYKVLVREEFTYEVLVKADEMIDAKDKAMCYEDYWGDSINREAYVYDVVELREKPNAEQTL